MDLNMLHISPLRHITLARPRLQGPLRDLTQEAQTAPQLLRLREVQEFKKTGMRGEGATNRHREAVAGLTLDIGPVSIGGQASGEYMPLQDTTSVEAGGPLDPPSLGQALYNLPEGLLQKPAISSF